MTTERALRLYSVEVDQWWDGSGEADQMLSAREWIESRFGQLDAEQTQRLRHLDDQVIAKAAEFKVAGSWDVTMLLKTAQVAMKHTAAA
jgi:hypothetical protein